MRTIVAFPIYASHTGGAFNLPAGAKIINVTLHLNQYFLHALCDNAAPNGWEVRHIHAYHGDCEVPDGDIGQFIGTCQKIGDYRPYHFFERAAIGGAA